MLIGAARIHDRFQNCAAFFSSDCFLVQQYNSNIHRVVILKFSDDDMVIYSRRQIDTSSNTIGKG